MDFLGKLTDRWQRSGSLLCVGLDPDLQRLPDHLAGHNDAIARFCKSIVDATAEFVCAFKPQIAYFASAGAEQQLVDVIAYIRDSYPDIPVVLDAKRGDIGSTATHYAREAFERYGADAVTINPYMGSDSISPYEDWPDKGVFLLCRTSNPGGDDLQQLSVQSRKPDESTDATELGEPTPLYETVATLAATQWNGNGQTGLVVGATYPAELARVRRIVGDMPLLVPGIGAQGGDIEATIAAGTDSQGQGMLINSSRAILYAGTGSDFAQAAGMAAAATHQAICRARQKCGICT